MEFGFPYDEVYPLTCKPNQRDLKNPFNTVKNDALGNFSITFFDTLDTFIIMGEKEKFKHYVKLIKTMYTDFAIDSTIQIFETNIRLLGSLLTSHLYAIDHRRGFQIENYDGFLLKLAYDLGKRLILSFSHDDDDERVTNDELLKNFVFNYPRTNLLHGPKDVLTKLKIEQCTAGITSLTLEFSLLSRLTNDTIFEDVSKRAVLDFWSRRTKLDLIPMAFDTISRTFPDSITGIGASIDSFYEYALKYSILFNDDLFMDIWKDSYKALLTHSQNKVGIFTNLDANSGMAVSEWIDSLGAFFPGLQVLGGDLKNSIKLHQIYFKLWNNYGAVPERWNFMPLRSESHFQHLERKYKNGDIIPGFDLDLTNELLVKNSVGLEWYPLRPELVESTYHLYKATKDPFYLRIGEDFLERLREFYIAPCGFSGSLDILHDRRQNRQESFVLSETIKYLFLLFDVNNDVQQGNTVFTTEGHPFWYDQKLLQMDPTDKEIFSEMNKWNETADATQGLFSRLLRKDKFVLNKKFTTFKSSFYKKIENIDPIIYRVRDLFAFDLTKTGDIIENMYGKRMRIKENYYEDVKFKDVSQLKIYAESMNKGLNLSYDYLNLDKCEIFSSTKEMLSSNILSNDGEFYRLDWDYAMTLRKPPYLTTKKELEIDDKFYSLFVDPFKGKCNLEQTSDEWEALMTSDETYNVAPIFKYQITSGVFKNGDLFIIELNGLRIRFEELKPGEVDSYGKVISEKSMLDMLASANGSVSFNSVMRITKVNGYMFNEDTILWTRSNSPLLMNSDHMEVLDGHVVVDGRRVVNFRVID
jgi:hypothetical protein